MVESTKFFDYYLYLHSRFQDFQRETGGDRYNGGDVAAEEADFRRYFFWFMTCSLL